MQIKQTRLLSQLLGLFLVLVSGNLVAQNVTVSGHLYESDGKTPVEAATVLVKSTGAGAITDEEGAYSLQTRRESVIELTFQYFGQSDSTVKVTTESGVSEYTVDLVYGSQGVTMSTQIITAGRHAQDLEDVTTSMDVIEPSKIDIQASQDIEDALQQGSGVDIIDGQPNIRGSSGYAYGAGSRVMVMLDGLPLLSPDAAFAQFDLIPTDNIAQIEIMKGASSVLYGSSALGGVINVITDDAPVDPKTSIRLRGQLFGAPADPRLDWDGDQNAASGGINVFHSRRIGKNKNHGITGLADFWRESGYRDPGQSLQGRFMAMSRFRPEKVKGLTFGVNAAYRFDSSQTFLFWDSYLPSDTVVSFAGDTIFNSLGAFSGRQSQRGQLNTRWTLDPFIKYLAKNEDIHFYRGRIMRTRNVNDTDQSNTNWLVYNDYQYTKFLLDDRMTWVAGVTGIYNLSEASPLYGNEKHQSINLAAYTQLDYKVNEKLNVSVGGRYDYILIDDSITNESPIFRAGANYEIRKGTNVRASFGQAFRSPSIAERYTATNASGLIIVPNPDIKVERGYSAEVGFRQGLQFGTKDRYVAGFVDVAGFMMDFDDMVEFGIAPPTTPVFPPPPPVFQARNVADARITGVEATGFVEVGVDDFYFSITGGVTYIVPENLNGESDSTKLVDLLNTLGPQDAAFNLEALGMYTAYSLPEDDPNRRVDNPVFLKYRSTWTNRVSTTIGYDRYALTANYRGKSEIVSIDQFLFVAIPGSADWVLANPGGFHVFDFIFAVDIIDNLKTSFHLENAFNREYVALPGIIQEPRNYTVQIKYVF